MADWARSMSVDVNEASKSIGTWRQANYKRFIFEHFLAATEKGSIPITGMEMRTLVRPYLVGDDGIGAEVDKTLSEVMDAWDEWIYAIKGIRAQ